MPSLNDKGADRKIFFESMVVKNKRYKETEFEIDKGRATPLFTKTGNFLNGTKKEYKAGTKLTILSTKLIVINGVNYANVQIGSVKGFIPISKIQKPPATNGTSYEQEVIDLLNKIIVGSGPLDIKIKGDSKIYKGISYAIQVDSKIKSKAGLTLDPKCDIILCRDKAKPLDPSSIYISHKKEGGPNAFQQYSGLSEKAGKSINKNKLTQKFLSIVADVLEDSDRLDAPIIGGFSDKTLANLAIYGPDYGKDYSLNHTTLIGQGKPTLKSISNGKYYELDFSSHMAISGELDHFKGGYEPIFLAEYRSGRSFEFNGKRYTGARVSISPIEQVKGRKNVTAHEL